MSDDWAVVRAREEREKLEGDARKLNRLVEVVAALGEGWEVVDVSCDENIYPNVTATDGAVRLLLVVGEYRNPDRLIVTGIYPAVGFTNHNEEYPKITCAFNRDTAALAKSIKSRIYDDVLAMTDRANEKERVDSDNAAKREIAISELERAGAKRSAHPRMRSDGMMTLSLPNSNAYVHDLRVSHDGNSVQMELRVLSVGQARRIIEILTQRTVKVLHEEG